MVDLGGLTENEENSVLEDELMNSWSGRLLVLSFHHLSLSTMLPYVWLSLTVSEDFEALRVALTVSEVFAAICAGENSVLEDELIVREATGVVILPSFFVNNAPLRGALNVSEVFEAICDAAGSEPDACKKSNTRDDVQQCVLAGQCPGSLDSFDTISFPVFMGTLAGGSLDSFDIVSFPVFMGTLAGVVVCFGLLGIIQWQRAQRQMRAQVRGIMASS